MKSYIPKYKQYLTNEAKSSNTILNYISDINHYFTLHDDISRENIIKYKSQIANLSVSSINRKLSSIKSFNEFLLIIGVIESIFVIKRDFIKKQQKGNPTNVTDSQVNIFLNEVSNNDNIMYKSRNMAIFYLIANTGIRRDEIANLKLRNLDLENKEIVLLGKGNKEREVYLNDVAIDVLKKYLKDRENHKFKDSPYIFVSERSEKLHQCSLNKICNKFNVEGCHITPHQLRHAYATNCSEQNVLTLPELQNQLGHSSLEVTSRYLHARKDNIKGKINNLKIGL